MAGVKPEIAFRLRTDPRWRFGAAALRGDQRARERERGPVDVFRSAHARGADWLAACGACLDQLDVLPPGANLGFLYVSDPFTEALDHIVARFRAQTGIEHWVGTAGLGVCAADQEYFGEGAVATLVAALPPGGFALFDALLRDGGDDLDARTRAWTGGAEGALAVVHADPRTPGAPEAIARFSAATGAFLVGGLSSSAVANVQLAGGPTEGGLSGVLLSPEVPALTALSQGCTPIGPRHRITACHRNLVLALDDRPALEVLREEIGELLARDLRRIGGYIHAALPVRGLDRADYLVRNLLAVDPDRGVLAIGAELRVGQELMFVKRDGASAQEDLRRMLADLDRRRRGRPVRGALYHACVARGPNMFGPDSAELGTIREALGDVPLAGFFANGEIFHDRLYAYTGVLTLFL